MITDSQLQEAIEWADHRYSEIASISNRALTSEDAYLIKAGSFARELLRVRALARKLLDAGTLDGGEREIVEGMVRGKSGDAADSPPEPSRKAGNGP